MNGPYVFVLENPRQTGFTVEEAHRERETFWHTDNLVFSQLMYLTDLSKWVFPKIGVPQNGWFIMEHPILKWMIWGYHYFRKHPNGSSINTTYFFVAFQRYTLEHQHVP